MTTPEAVSNGNPPPVVDNAMILAAVNVAISKSESAEKVAIEARDLVLDVHRATKRLASDHFELRTGIPPSWRRRLALAAVAAAIGAFAALGVGCALGRGIF